MGLLIIIASVLIQASAASYYGFGQSLGKEFAESIKVGMESLANGMESHGKDVGNGLKSFGKDAASEIGFYVFLSTVVICFTIYMMMKGNDKATPEDKASHERKGQSFQQRASLQKNPRPMTTWWKFHHSERRTTT